MKSTAHIEFQFFVLALVWFVGCSSTESSKSESIIEETISEDTFQSFKMNLNAPKIDFTELIEEVQIIKLEETEKSLLGNASNLTITENYLVICNNREGDFYIFDRKGDFISSFNRLGNGPEEIVRLWGYWVDGERIMVHDAGRSQIVAYSLEGEFLDKFDLPYERTNHVRSTGDYLWIEVSTVVLEDSTMAQLSRYSLETGEDSLFLIQNERPSFDMPTTMSSFSSYNDGMVFKRFLSDSAFLVKNGSVEPLMHFDFGEEFMWQGDGLELDPQKGFEVLQSTEKVWQVWPFIGENWVYLRFHNSMRSPARFMVINTMTSAQYEVNRRVGGQGSYSYNERLWHEGRFVIDMASDDLGDFLGNLDESQYSFEDGSSLDIIESSENPALIWIKFKESL